MDLSIERLGRAKIRSPLKLSKEAGDHIVTSSSLYGGTYNLFHYTLPKLGIAVDFVEDPDDLESWRAAIRPNTKAFFGETISNPQIDVLDVPGVADVAHADGIPLIVDNTSLDVYFGEHGVHYSPKMITPTSGGVSVEALDGPVLFTTLRAHELKSIWK